MKRLGKIISYTLVKDNQIPKNQYYIYTYLFDYILEFNCFIIIILSIGFIVGKIDLSLCYLFVTIPLRLFAGGIHAKTKFACTIITYSLFVVVLLTSQITCIISSFLLIVYFFCWVIILSIAPVDTENKRLSRPQKNKLHHKCKITFIIMTAVVMFLWYNNQNLYYSTISICVILDTVGLLLGKWKNRRQL